MNYIAGAGPDFKSQYVDHVPVSNADVGQTIASLLGLKLGKRGELVGPVMEKSLRGGRAPSVAHRTVQAHGPAGNIDTQLDYFTVNGTRYLEAGGTPGRTLGLHYGATIAGK